MPDSLRQIEIEHAKLKRWLNKAQWSVEQAVYLLAGLDPDIATLIGEPGDSETWLLGARRRPSDDRYPNDLANELLHRTFSICRNERPQAPAEWIECCTAAGFKPRWLEHVQQIPELIDRISANKPAVPSTTMSHSERAKVRWSKDPGQIAIMRIGKPMFDAWSSEGFPKSKFKNRTKLAEGIKEKIENEQPHPAISHSGLMKRFKKWKEAKT